MKKRQRWTGYFILAGGLFFIYQSVGLSLGPAGQPGPGFLGFFLGLGLAVCSVTLILLNRGADGTAPERRGKSFWDRGAWKKPALGLAVLAAFAVMMWLLGTPVTLVLFFLFWLRVLEKNSWLIASGVAAAGSFCFYLLFEVLLQIPLPRGIFFA